MGEDKVFVNIEVPSDLHTHLKSVAAFRRLTLKAAVIQAIEKWVQSPWPKDPVNRGAQTKS